MARKLPRVKLTTKRIEEIDKELLEQRLAQINARVFPFQRANDIVQFQKTGIVDIEIVGSERMPHNQGSVRSIEVEQLPRNVFAPHYADLEIQRVDINESKPNGSKLRRWKREIEQLHNKK